MSILPSAQRQDQNNVLGQETLTSSTPSVTLGEGSLLALAIVRVFLGYLWFQQLFWKLPPSFAGLHSYVVARANTPFYLAMRLSFSMFFCQIFFSWEQAHGSLSSW